MQKMDKIWDPTVSRPRQPIVWLNGFQMKALKEMPFPSKLPESLLGKLVCRGMAEFTRTRYKGILLVEYRVRRDIDEEFRSSLGLCKGQKFVINPLLFYDNFKARLSENSLNFLKRSCEQLFTKTYRDFRYLHFVRWEKDSVSHQEVKLRYETSMRRVEAMHRFWTEFEYEVT